MVMASMGGICDVRPHGSVGMGLWTFVMSATVCPLARSASDVHMSEVVVYGTHDFVVMFIVFQLTANGQ